MNPQTMTVRFNCHTAVRPAIITVRIEFEDDTLDAVQFQIARDNVRTVLRAARPNPCRPLPIERLTYRTADVDHLRDLGRARV